MRKEGEGRFVLPLLRYGCKGYIHTDTPPLLACHVHVPPFRFVPYEIGTFHYVWRTL